MIVKEVVQAILAQYRLPLNSLHGPAHWARVLENGRRLATQTGARDDVLLLFALFHDACRHTDGTDIGHGRRGGRLAESLHGTHIEIDEAGLDLLVYACSNHTSGWNDRDVTVQTCWDADRLDLGRAGISPSPRRLCTLAASDPQILAWANTRSQAAEVPGWVEVEWGINL